MKSDQSKTKNQLTEEINKTSELVSEIEPAELKRSHVDSINESQRIPAKIGIGKKIYSGFGAVGLLLTCAIIITLASINSLNTNIQMTYDHPLIVTRAATLIEFKIVKMHRSMKDVTLTESTETRNKYIRKVKIDEKETLKQFDKVQKQILGEEGQKLAVSARKAFLQWRPIRQQVIALMEAEEYPEARRITQNEGDNYVELLIAEVEKLVNYAANKALVFNSESAEIADQTWVTALITLSFSLLMGIVITVSFLRDITNRLAQINQAAIKMTDGDLHQVIQIRGKDELTRVADSFNIMANQLSTSYETLEQRIDKRTKELRDSEEKILNERNKFNSILQALPIGVSVLDSKDKYVYINPMTTKIEGYKHDLESLIGKDVKNNHPKHTLPIIEELLNDFKSDKKSYSSRVAKRGKRSVKISYHANRNGKGEYKGLIRLVSDITERKQAEDELQKSLEERDKELTSQAMFMAQRKEFLITIIDKLQLLYAQMDIREKPTIRKIINQLEKQVTPGREWDEFEIWFREVHKNFYRKLTENYPDLSTRELKICAFLKLSLSSKEIASLTNLTVKTIEVYRSQLRKKLQVSPGVNLTKFISKI